MSVDTLDLPIGHELMLQLSGEEARFRSAYYGQKPNEFLIVQMPGIPGVREKLAVSAAAVIRFLVSGKVYGFKTDTCGAVYKPCPLIFLRYPDKVESINLRKSERVTTFLEATGTIDNQVMSGIIVDLSAGGCLFLVNRSTGLSWPTIEPGHVFILEFALSKEDAPFVFPAQVINVRKEVERLRIGAKFLLNEEKDQDVTARLSEYIKNIADFMRGVG